MATTWKRAKIKVASINMKGNTQPRVTMDRKTIEEYQEEMEEGVEFPAPKVFYDGKEYWLGDGFHRMRAITQIGLVDIQADVTKGDRRDAQLFAAGANHDHGLRRKPEDKRKAALTLLTDKEWKTKSNAMIAEHCHVSAPFVGTLRKELEAQGKRQPTERQTKAGNTQNVSNVGRKSKKPKAPEPEVEEAEEEEVSTPSPAATKPDKDAVKAYFEGRYGKASPENRVVAFKIFRVISELLALPENMNIPEVGSAIKEMRSMFRSFWGMKWADGISAADRSACTRTLKGMFAWIEEGTPLKLDEPKAPGKTKTKYEPTEDAQKALEWWKKNVGLPHKRKPDPDYCKAFDMMHTTDKLSWNDIKEILVGYTICWQPEGYEVHSPLALRQNTSKGDVKKWEAIWKAYKKHPKYKPLSKAPVCPVEDCGIALTRQEAQKDGRLYLAYFCKKHPVESAPVGQKFVPRVLVKK